MVNKEQLDHVQDQVDDLKDSFAQLETKFDGVFEQLTREFCTYVTQSQAPTPPSILNPSEQSKDNLVSQPC